VQSLGDNVPACLFTPGTLQLTTSFFKKNKGYDALLEKTANTLLKMQGGYNLTGRKGGHKSPNTARITSTVGIADPVQDGHTGSRKLGTNAFISKGGGNTSGL